MKPHRPVKQHGFTLLEVMVAVAILASGLTVILGGISMSTRSTALAVGYEKARTVANNQLALYVSSRPRQGIKTSGEENDVQWNLRAEALPDNKALLHIIVEASFFAPGGTRTVMLETREAVGSTPATSSFTQSAANGQITPP